MAQVLQQTREESQVVISSAESMKEQMKQPEQRDMTDMNMQKAVVVEQKFAVEVIAKNQEYNPQEMDLKLQNEEQNTSRYGPFHSLSPNAQALLNTENLNYEISIQPILNNSSKQKIQTKKSPKPRKSQSILTQESVQEHSSKASPQQLQKQIIQLAKNIRKKVLKKQPLNQHSKTPDQSTQIKLRKLYQKRQSLFEKYSYPHSTGVTIAELEKQEQRLKLGKYNISRVYHQQQQFQPHQSESQAKPFQQVQSTGKSALQAKRSKSRTQDSPSGRKQSQLPKLKLSFDKTHHKYQMTEFRKSILRENKDRELAKTLMIKEKEQTLQKRRQIYNSSRYHPVGIKLSSLRLSKLVNKSIIEKGPSESIVIEENATTEQGYKINSMGQGEEVKLQQTHRKMDEQDIGSQKVQQKVDLHPMNQSQAKSSLTFNFSFGDPIQAELKSSAQVYSQLQNLTKMLQNDSTPKQRLQKMEKQQQQQQNQHINSPNKVQIANLGKQAKKWTSNGIEKEMTESKVIGEVERLHNSSEEEYGEEDKDVQLEYSYV